MHLAALIPGEKTVRSLVDAGSDERDGRLCAVFAQEGKSEGIVALISVVKGQQYRLLRKRRAVVELTGSQFARQDCRIAVIAQEVEVAPQRGDGHGVVCRLRRIFRKVVVFQHVKAPVGRGLCGVSLGRAHRRGKGLGHCAAVEVRRTHGDGLCAVRLLKERNGEDDDEHARE